MATAKTGVRLPAMASCRKERRLVWAALLAAIWSLAYGLLGAYWAVGGAGFPYGPRGDGTPGWMSLIDDTRHDFGGLVIAVLGTTGAMAALAMACGRGRGVGRAALLGFAWTLTAILLLVVPDARVLALVGYLPALVFALGFEAVDWPMLNQVACLAGAPRGSWRRWPTSVGGE